MASASEFFDSIHRQDHAGALEAVCRRLKEVGDCPYFLVQRALLIQIAEDPRGLTLKDAESDLNRAHKLDPRFLEALEELAHFYDAVNPDPDKARYFARLCVERARLTLSSVQPIAEARG